MAKLMHIRHAFFILLMLMISNNVCAQIDTMAAEVKYSQNIFQKDERLKKLGQEMAAYNESLAKKTRLVKGYRLMLLNTNDRNYAMKVRSTLLQQFPEQKLYLTFIAPNVKLKIGNFTDKESAEKFRKQLQDMKLINEDIYLLNEPVELKPAEKNADTDEP